MKRGGSHSFRALEWQLFSSKLIFWLVILIVVTGIFFSWQQLRQSIREREVLQATIKNIPAPDDALRHELQAGIRGIKLATPMVGVVILAMSLLFFYLYLQFVYPINGTGQLGGLL